MAISVESSNKVWQKVKTALSNANPAAQAAFDELKKYLATQKRNPDLQFVPFTEVQADVAGGTVIVDAASKVYGVYVKKENEGTDNMVFLYDDATNDGTAADAKVGLDLADANEEAFAIFPAGSAFGAGVVVTQYSDGIGATDGSNGANGFVIIGQP